MIDGNNLCWRAFYATQSARLSFDGAATGILFGLLNDMITICDELAIKNLMWFFDSPEKLRSEMFPGYKAKRNTGSPEAMKLRQEAQKMISGIPKILRNIGFSNVHKERGFEADDLIAQAASQLTGKCDTVFVVSSDEDLFQTIRPDVTMYDPKNRKFLTWDGFIERYNLSPERWDEVKAIAGCSGDDIPGIRGVGEKTAIKYLLGEPIRKGLVDGIAAGADTIERNSKLVRLPHPSTPKLELCFIDFITKAKWDSCLQKYGMTSLRKKGYPFQ